MAECIEKGKLMDFPIRMEHYDKEHGNLQFVLGIESVLEYAENLPTVDAEPVRHGKWRNDGIMEICSECNMPTMQPHIARQPQFKICPYCGAKMDGE